MPVCIAFILLLTLLMLPLLPPSLVVSSNGKVLYEKVIDSGYCEVDFCHSVNKGNIREVYLLNPEQGCLTLQTGYFQSFGAGMIDTVEATKPLNFRQEGDYYLLDFPEQWQKEIHYIGGNVAGHVFCYDGDKLPLGTLYPKRPFTLSVERRSVLQRSFRRL